MARASAATWRVLTDTQSSDIAFQIAEKAREKEISRFAPTCRSTTTDGVLTLRRWRRWNTSSPPKVWTRRT
jgi:hypothetical protein